MIKFRLKNDLTLCTWCIVGYIEHAGYFYAGTILIPGTHQQKQCQRQPAVPLLLQHLKH